MIKNEKVECPFFMHTVPISSCKKAISEDKTAVMCPVMHGGKCDIEGIDATPSLDYPLVDEQAIRQAQASFLYSRFSH